MTQPTSSEPKKLNPMVEQLYAMIRPKGQETDKRERKVRDRKSLAVLRRAFSNDGIDFSAYTVVGRFLPRAVSLRDHEPFLLTACLFAVHQLPITDGRSIGSAARVLRARLASGQESLDRRFTAVLNARGEDVAIHLRHLFTLLKSQDVAVDYAVLLEDLRSWHYQSRSAQIRWAHDYWVGQGDEEPGAGLNDTSNDGTVGDSTADDAEPS